MRSGSPTTTARHPAARSRSSRPRCRSAASSRRRPPKKSRSRERPSRSGFSPEQQAAIARIAAGGGPYLLYGATGSGKTEVYLQACAAALERGLGAIVLVPEIALAPQTVGRVRARFGDQVAILHSGLTDAERRDERERIASGAARIVVGARSAIFAPVLGLIVVDEEHDASYKQDSDPRYDARTVAAKRAALEGAVAVYGSATPRPESWASLERLELGGRLAGDLPPVRIVDLRREAGYPLSAPLLAELREDRRAAAARRSCCSTAAASRPRSTAARAGTTIRCPDCDVALVLHRDQSLRCHHCGHSESVPEACPACGSADLARLGAGTQRLERELEREFPELELIRLDADTDVEARVSHRRAAKILRRRTCVVLFRHADGGEGPPLLRRRARRGDRRRHLARQCPTSAPRSARSS